ncbi:MAG: TolC family protein, partial [Spirochaetales bacterium]|nr:TolC family protein [Spirochaetales bacterium]
YPTISGSIPLSLTGFEENNYTTGVDIQKSQSLAAEQGISIVQLLPTAGSLTAEISDSVAMNRLIEIVPTGFPADPEWTNTAAISLTLSQPVFFKGAFGAAFEIIGKTYENNSLDVLESRNFLAISAVQSFYDLKQAVFNQELVQIRFMKDKENYKRINQEFEMGLWTKSELYQAKSILIKSEIDLIEAAQILDTARQSMILHYSLSTDFNVSSTVNPLDSEELQYDSILDEIISNNPAARHAKNLLGIQKASLTVLRKDDGPVLSLGGSYSYITDIENSGINQKTFSLSLGLSGNLFNGGTDSAKMEAEKAVLEQLESNLSALLIDLEIETKSISNSLARSYQLKELYYLQEEAAYYEFEKGVKDLELGQITEKELSELQINLENARLSKQQNIINANML